MKNLPFKHCPCGAVIDDSQTHCSDECADMPALKSELSTLKQRNSELEAKVKELEKYHALTESVERGMQAKLEQARRGLEEVFSNDRAREAVIEAAREAEHSAGCELMREHSIRALWHCTCDLGKALAALDALEAGKEKS